MPLWGVWADKYSRKAVIVRSALVEAVVFACVALSREPWQLALSVLLIGLQLGNTGVMLAGDPRRRPAGTARDGDRDLRRVRADRFRRRAVARAACSSTGSVLDLAGDVLGVGGPVGR